MTVAAAAPALRYQPPARTGAIVTIGFAAVIGILLLAGAGGLVRMIYPVGAIAVGLYLLLVNTPGYVSFVLWLWSLTAFVRRVADLQAGWQDPSLVLLTPYLVAASCAVVLVGRAVVVPGSRLVLPAGGMLFVIAALGVACGIPLGFAAHTAGAQLETLNWVVPLMLGWFIASRTDDIEAIERAVVSTLGQVAIVAGAYGMYQFFDLPAWDANWMLNSGMRSIGFAEALGVRVFSTMHSPGVLGYFTLVALICWLANPRAVGLPALCLASVVLLLSQVRTAWFGFAIAALLVLPSLRLKAGLRVVILVVLGAFCVMPFLTLPDVSERVSGRLETLKDVSADYSANSRLEGHLRTFEFFADHPFGAGIGADPPQLTALVGMRDSVVVAILVQFGSVGAALYVLALGVLGVRLWRFYRCADTPESLGLACAAIGVLSTTALGMPVAGVPGMLLWLLGGIATARLARQAPAAAVSRTWAAADAATASGVSISPQPAGGHS